MVGVLHLTHAAESSHCHYISQSSNYASSERWKRISNGKKVAELWKKNNVSSVFWNGLTYSCRYCSVKLEDKLPVKLIHVVIQKYQRNMPSFMSLGEGYPFSSGEPFTWLVFSNVKIYIVPLYVFIEILQNLYIK